MLKEQHILAHDLLAAATSYATGQSPATITTTTITTMGAEALAPKLSQYLYGTEKVADLNTEQKQTISNVLGAVAGEALNFTSSVVEMVKDTKKKVNQDMDNKLSPTDIFINAQISHMGNEVAKNEYCQQQPNSQACLDKINNVNVSPWSNKVSEYANHVKEAIKAGANAEAEVGGTAVVGLGVRQNTGLVIDSTRKTCATYTTCVLAGPMVGGFVHTGGSVSTGTLTPNSRTWQLGYVVNITPGIGGNHGGTINSDGSFTYGGEGTVGGAVGGAIMICSKKVDGKCQ